MSPVASIVIPAHDEEAVILRCLDSIHADARPGEWQVVVAANGCSDRTVELARAHPSHPECLDLPEPGKPGALNAADSIATALPRIYLDADIEVSSASLRSLVATLKEPGVLAASPAARYLTDGCSLLVRSYYRIWQDLPVLQDGYVGSGVYGLSAEGHLRVSPFPDLVGDDAYVVRSFHPAERRRSGGTFDVRVARTARSLVRRGIRVRAGNRQLAAALPDLVTQPDDSTMRYVLGRARHPRDIPDVAVFVAVTVLIRVLGEAKLRFGDMRAWDRDDSSRVASPSSPTTPGRTGASTEQRNQQ